MYRSASERQNHIARTASASTRGSATGRLPVPPGAAEPEAYFNTIRDQYDNVCELVLRTREKIDAVDRELRQRVSNSRYAVLRAAREEAGAVLGELERRAAEYNVLAKVAAMDAFGATFIEIARRQMDPVLFKKLMYETEMMLERKPDGGIALPGEGRRRKPEETRTPAWAKPTEASGPAQASRPPRPVAVPAVSEADRPFPNRLRPGRKTFGQKYGFLGASAEAAAEAEPAPAMGGP